MAANAHAINVSETGARLILPGGHIDFRHRLTLQVGEHETIEGAPGLKDEHLAHIAAVNYGTGLANVAKLLGLGSCVGIIGCQQMAIGSSFLNDLNAGDDTIGSVSYTNIVTSMDEIIVPYTNGYLNNDGNNTNTNVRGQCWGRVIGHISIALDGAVYSGIQDALAHRAIDYNCWAL